MRFDPVATALGSIIEWRCIDPVATAPGSVLSVTVNQLSSHQSFDTVSLTPQVITPRAIGAAESRGSTAAECEKKMTLGSSLSAHFSDPHLSD